MQVIKRDGSTVDFQIEKISQAIQKAFDAQKIVYNAGILNLLALHVTSEFQSKIKDNKVTVEDIQDCVENTLIQAGYGDVAKAYILYRKQREKIRNLKATTLDYKDVIEGYTAVEDWRVKENSTVTYSIGGLILSNSGAVTANYWLSEIYDKEIADAHRNADIHIHDLSMLTGYCAGWSLKQLIQEGLGGIQGKITSSPAKHLSVLCNQMVNFLGILQNEWAGAQAFSSFDTYLAPFVKVDDLSYEEVKKCIESFIYGVNIPSRWGCVDTDTEVLSTEGFKKYNELKEGDMIYTWKDGCLELNPVRKVIQKPFKGKLHEYMSPGYNQTVTPNHRMLVCMKPGTAPEIKRSEEIFDKARHGDIMLPVQAEKTNIPGILFRINENLITLGALYYAYSRIVDNEVVIEIPSNTGNLTLNPEIKNALAFTNLAWSITSKEEDGQKFQVLIFHDEYAEMLRMMFDEPNTIKPQFFTITNKCAELFLKTWSGIYKNDELYVCNFKSDAIRDQLQHMAILAGMCSYVKDDAVFIDKTKKAIVPDYVSEIDYDGIVWCPNVENGTAVFRKDGCVYISGQTQAPFSNVTLDWTVPDDLAELNAIVGGKEMNFKYKDCKREMDMINKAFIEIMIEGDANGRGFQYPMDFVA